MGSDGSAYRRGWRFRAGIIAPSVWDYEQEYREMLPDGGNLVVVTLGATDFSEQSMNDARKRRGAAATELDERGVSCIIAAGGPVSTLQGRPAERQFIEKTNQRLDTPFTTVLEAQVDALSEVGAQKIATMTPFPKEREDERIGYLEEAGFDVVASGGVSLFETYDTRRTSENVIYESVAEIVETEADFDTVYVGCAPFGNVEQITPIEEDFDCSVIMSTQAQVWKALQMAGKPTTIDGYGR